LSNGKYHRGRYYRMALEKGWPGKVDNTTEHSRNEVYATRILAAEVDSCKLTMHMQSVRIRIKISIKIKKKLGINCQESSKIDFRKPVLA
jgi:hypothetical protein